MRLMVTGGSGFVGRATVERMQRVDDVVLTLPLRSTSQVSVGGVKVRLVGDHIGDHGWARSLVGQDVIVHLAGRAHVRRDSAGNSLAAFRAVNVSGTLNLARLAIKSRVRRFVFISSIGVNGPCTEGKNPFSEGCIAAPHADYAISKWEAEQGLWELVRDSDMELVIIRPPLIYAGNAPGNFGRLLKLVASGIPLPFASIANDRSMIALDNLVDFIALCIDHPAAANEVFVISDGQDVSTPQIIRYLAQGMNKTSRLVPVPQAWLRVGARIIGKKNMYSQLCESLVVDPAKARQVLGWRPVISTADALTKAGRDFLNIRTAG